MTSVTALYLEVYKLSAPGGGLSPRHNETHYFVLAYLCLSTLRLVGACLLLCNFRPRESHKRSHVHESPVFKGVDLKMFPFVYFFNEKLETLFFLMFLIIWIGFLVF